MQTTLSLILLYFLFNIIIMVLIENLVDRIKNGKEESIEGYERDFNFIEDTYDEEIWTVRFLIFLFGIPFVIHGIIKLIKTYKRR